MMTLQTIEDALEETAFRQYMDNSEISKEDIRNLDFRTQQILLNLYSDTVEDPLTGLLNRRACQVELEDRLTANQFQKRVGDSTRFRQGISIIYMDLDEFKPINDEFGHDAGDEVLRYAADVIRSELPRRIDSFRPMGDEFILIYNGSERKAVELKNRVVKKIEEGHYEIKAEKGEPCRGTVRVSAGIKHIPSGYNATHGIREAREAEEKMYTEKKGR